MSQVNVPRLRRGGFETRPYKLRQLSAAGYAGDLAKARSALTRTGRGIVLARVTDE
jgi:hypothetical protein